MARARIVAALGLGLFAIAPFACVVVADDDNDGWPPPLSWTTCASNSQCVLVSDTCCGPCGPPTLDDVAPVNRALADAYNDALCPEPLPCPACATANNPNLLATCDARHCAELDVRAHPSTACARDEDCRLRVTGCCECGGSTAPYDLIAVNVAGEALYAALVCDPQQACPECMPIYPGEVEAYCAPGGHCAVRPATGCDEDCGPMGLACCGRSCVATYNDANNCGACGNACTGPHPYCDGGACGEPPCELRACAGDAFCCGAECCAPGQLCCAVPGPGPAMAPRCVDPDADTGSCPVGCPLCN